SSPFLATLPDCKAEILKPAPQLPLGTWTVDFSWTTGINVTEYSFNVGTTAGGGQYFDQTTRNITTASGTPIVITTGVAHGYSTNDAVHIEGATGNTAANGNWIIQVLPSTTF